MRSIVRILSALQLALLVLLFPPAAYAGVVDVTDPRLIINNRSPTPNVIGGVRLDAATLTVSNGALRRGDIVFSGSADHAATARLATEMRMKSSLGSDIVAAGTPVFNVEFADTQSPGLPIVSLWCGNLNRKGLFNTPGPVVCFFDGVERGGSFWSLPGRPWLMTSQLARNYPHTYEGFQIEPSATDLFGPMDVKLTVSRIRRTEIDLALTASRDGDDMIVMRFRIPVTNGQAELPLWDHRLSFAVDSESVKAAMSSDGNGMGPLGLGTYPNN